MGVATTLLLVSACATSTGAARNQDDSPTHARGLVSWADKSPADADVRQTIITTNCPVLRWNSSVAIPHGYVTSIV